MIYRYISRRLPGPNTGNFSFEPVQALPCNSVLGPGFSPMRQVQTTQPVQAQWFQALLQMSLNGIVHGTISAQPLSEGYSERGNI
jgi:hypothetical protein